VRKSAAAATGTPRCHADVASHAAVATTPNATEYLIWRFVRCIPNSRSHGAARVLAARLANLPRRRPARGAGGVTHTEVNDMARTHAQSNKPTLQQLRIVGPITTKPEELMRAWLFQDSRQR
jgi:hypothetical protein